MKETNIYDLPRDMLITIIEKLGAGDQRSLATTCKFFSGLFSDLSRSYFFVGSVSWTKYFEGMNWFAQYSFTGGIFQQSNIIYKLLSSIPQKIKFYASKEQAIVEAKLLFEKSGYEKPQTITVCTMKLKKLNKQSYATFNQGSDYFEVSRENIKILEVQRAHINETDGFYLSEMTLPANYESYMGQTATSSTPVLTP